MKLYALNFFLPISLSLIFHSHAVSQVKSPDLFPVYYYSDTLVYMPLGEIYPYSAHPDSSIFSKNQTILKDNQKHIFYDRTGFGAMDTLFIMDLEHDTVYCHAVLELELISFPDIYIHEDIEELQESDIHVGFCWNEKELKPVEFGFHFCIAMLAQKNPFLTGRVKKLVWNQRNISDLPLIFLSDDSTHKYTTLSKLAGAFQFHYNNYTYWMATDNIEYYNCARIVVFEDSTNRKVLDEIIYISEGIVLSPYAVHGSENRINYQWTGAIFADYPIMINGFENFTFWCERLFFLDSQPVYFKCDNRY